MANVNTMCGLINNAGLGLVNVIRNCSTGIYTGFIRPVGIAAYTGVGRCLSGVGNIVGRILR
jgi:hypothetical protein